MLRKWLAGIVHLLTNIMSRDTPPADPNRGPSEIQKAQHGCIDCFALIIKTYIQLNISKLSQYTVSVSKNETNTKPKIEILELTLTGTQQNQPSHSIPQPNKTFDEVLSFVLSHLHPSEKIEQTLSKAIQYQLCICMVNVLISTVKLLPTTSLHVLATLFLCPCWKTL